MGNDTSIIAGFICFFLVLGGILPFVSDGFGQDTIKTDINKSLRELEKNVEEAKATNLFIVFFSMIKMFFWTFGQIPWYLELVLLEPVRLTFYFILARNIWVGGGG